MSQPSWMLAEHPFPYDPRVEQEVLYACSAAEARTGRVNSRVALFTDDSLERTRLLLSPEAAQYVGLLPGDWRLYDPSGESWAVLYSAGASPDDLGLTPAWACVADE